MYLASVNKGKQLLVLYYSGKVKADELRLGLDDLRRLLTELSPGFRVLADFTQLETMAMDCATEIGTAMEMIGQQGVALIVRVMPDASKDIGLNILTNFHYAPRPRIVTCDTLTEAAEVLKL